MKLYLTVFCVILFLSFIVLVIAIIVQKEQAKKKKQLFKTQASSKRNYLFFFYRIFMVTPVIRRYFRKILKKVETIYPADPIAINNRATGIMLRAVIVMLICIILGIFVSGNDVYYICASVLTSYLIFDMMINAGFDRMERKLLTQFSTFLSDVRHYYHESKIIEDAIYNTLDDSPYEIGLHIQKIYDILISPHMEEKVAEYVTSAPNRYLLTFVSICASIKDYGDKKLENGSTLFLTNSNYLKEEINIELLKMANVRNAFSGLAIISIVPVMTLKIIEAWAVSNIEELSKTYSGSYGIIIMTVIFVLSFICYVMISMLRDTRRENIKEKTIWVKLSNLPIWSTLFNREINRNYGKQLKINDDLKTTGDHTGPKAFLCKRVVYALVTIICMNVLFAAANIKDKIKIINDYSNEFDESIVPNEEYLESMYDCAEDFSKMYKGQTLTEEDKEAITKQIIATTNINNVAYATMVMESVDSHVTEYNKVYYKWYYFIISLFGAILGFYLPYLFLKFKVSILNMSKEDEVNQFNTLMLILMYVDGVTLDMILEWLDRFAYCFKPSISKCIINLEFGEAEALQTMKSEETFPPFRRFVDSLMSIDNIGVASAFDEIATERDYYKEKRKQDNLILTNRKAFYAKVFSYIPLIVTIAMYIILPMLVMAIKMMTAMDLSF